MDFKQFVDNLKGRASIIEVASRYLNLERKGGNHWACCPFHHEKTPSFSIKEEGYYHCFGCGESGDVISLVQHMESVDFMGAVEILAKMYGMEIPPSFSKTKDTDKDDKKRLFQLMRETALFYHKTLISEKGKTARDYLAKRQIDLKTATRFGLGLSPDFDSLINYLLKKGYKREELVETKVAGEKNGRIYDNLGNRLIVPIIDSFKRVVAFGGRTLEEKPKFAKYKNTDNTVLFNKSKVLYGLNLVKEERLTSPIKDIIIVEGYMDAISLYEAGYKNVVASMGTALTKDQAKLIKYMVKDVIISYDGDFAGMKASLRGLDILDEEGLSVKVVVLDQGMDPDDTIKKFGRDHYDEKLKQALPLVDFKLFLLKKETDFSDPQQRRDYTKSALGVIGKVKEKSLEEELLVRLSKETGISILSLSKDLESKPEKKQKTEKEEERVFSTLEKAQYFVMYMLIKGRKSLKDVEKVKACFHGDLEKVIAEIEEKGKVTDIFALVGAKVSDDILSFKNLGQGNFLAKENLSNIREEEEKYFLDSIATLRKEVSMERIAQLKEELIHAKGEDKARIIKEIQKETIAYKM